MEKYLKNTNIYILNGTFVPYWCYIMDEKDKQILFLLEENSSLSTREIAKKTLLPITTVHNRITKLKEQKIITKFTIEVDHQAVDEDFSVYILISANLETLKTLGRSQHDLARDLKKIPQVKKVDIVSGGTDVVAYLRTKDVHAYDMLLLEKIQQISGISKTQSLIVMHEIR